MSARSFDFKIIGDPSSLSRELDSAVDEPFFLTKPGDDMPLVSFTIFDKPTGKARPRVNANGHVWTPADTKRAEKNAVKAWQDAGRPELPKDVALSASLIFYLKRPPSHYRVDGRSLSASGRKAGRVFSRNKPDFDNAAKLICDALEGHAYPHDAAIASAHVTKLWTDGEARIVVRVEPIRVEWENRP